MHNLIDEARTLEHQIETILSTMPQTVGHETANARRLERALADVRRFISRYEQAPVVIRRPGPFQRSATCGCAQPDTSVVIG